MIGFLLIIFGSISLWLDKSTSASDRTRLGFCKLLICSATNNDSPTVISPPPDKSIALAREELVLNPASAYRWADLADSEINANQLDKGKYCAREALASAPGNPAILFRAATVYLRLEEYPEALKHLGAVLRNPDLANYYDHVFALYSQMDLPLDDLLNQGIPRTTQAANAFLRFWIHQEKLDEAQETWTWINQNGLTSLPSAGSYVALLSKLSRWDEALASWSDYTSRLDAAFNVTNWIYNAGFELTPVDCPFDWHLVSSPVGEATRDTDEAYKGIASLRIKYYGSEKGVNPTAYQTVLLKPGKWQLSASMRTQSLTGSQGVVVRVVDANHPANLDVATNTFQRTQEWTTVSRLFEVPPGTHLARVEILRPPVEDSDIKVTGSVWVDAIQLVPWP